MINQVVARCDSTNNLARKMAEEGCPHGSWVSCRIQETGRGRQGRKWESIEGNLFLSYVARIPNPTLWTWVPLAASVAIVRGVRSLFPDIALQIKWPNDIYFQSAKVGGILCEGTSSFIVIGIGLNCVKAPQGLDQATTGLSQIHAGDPVVADQIRMPIVQALTEEFDHLIQNGPNRISQLYQAWAALPSGTPIQWGKSVEQQGWVETLGASGELLVKDKNGATIRLFAEDVSVRRITS